MSSIEYIIKLTFKSTHICLKPRLDSKTPCLGFLRLPLIGAGLGAGAEPEGGSLLWLKELPLLSLDILVEDPSGDVRADAIVALLGIRFGGLLHLKL